jgi:hypothetical protein
MASNMPKMTDKHDHMIYTKASARFQNIIRNHGLPRNSPEPKRIHFSKILPSPFNRLGNVLNMQYLHQELLPNIKKDGFRTSRPTPGMVVRRRDPARLARLHTCARNLVTSVGAMLPSITIDASADRECLGANHLTMVLRMYACNFSSPMTGAKCVGDEDPDLMMTVAEGHLYIELDDDVSDEDCKFLSELLNSDQNQNQANSEDHLRLLIESVMDEMISAKTPTVTTSDIVKRVCEMSVVKLKPDHVGDAAQYIVAYHGSPYVQQLSRWYSLNVNPRQISISARWMADISRLWGRSRPLSKLGATMLHYRGLSVTPGTAPNPDTSRTVDVPLMTSLAQAQKGNLDQHELILRENREKYEVYLKAKLGDQHGMDLFLIFEEASARLLCSKSLVMKDFAHTVSGKYCAEKHHELQAAWLKLIGNFEELKGMSMQFGLPSGSSGSSSSVPEEADSAPTYIDFSASTDM